MPRSENSDTKMILRMSKDLKRIFHVECVKRDITMSYLIKDYIKKQLNFWQKQEREKDL
jgi:hypothetical protein